MVKNLPAMSDTWVRSLGHFTHKGLYSQCCLYSDALHHFMQIDGETMESVIDFIILEGSKVTADGDFSHEIKICLLLGRKAATNLNSLLKSRDITLPTKVHVVKAMFFPVVMHGCDSWDYKEC